MPDEFGLLPGVPPRGPGRYAPGTRPAKAKPWAAAEDLALWPPLLACESERAYLRTCVRLCELLDRKPGLSGPHPPSGLIVVESVSLVEQRTVTRHIGDRSPELLALVMEMGATPRVGLELTWAEKRRFLRPYYGKPDSRIPLESLMLLLGRPKRDTCLVDGYLRALAARPEPRDEEDLRVPCVFDRTYQWDRLIQTDCDGREYGMVARETNEPETTFRRLVSLGTDVREMTLAKMQESIPDVRAAYVRLTELCLP